MTFFLENTCACVLGPWPWPRVFLSLTLRGSVLGRAVLGLGFFCVLGHAFEPCVLDSTSGGYFMYRFHLRSFKFNLDVKRNFSNKSILLLNECLHFTSFITIKNNQKNRKKYLILFATIPHRKNLNYRRGPKPLPPIEMLSMIKMSQKRLLF